MLLLLYTDDVNNVNCVINFLQKYLLAVMSLTNSYVLQTSSTYVITCVHVAMYVAIGCPAIIC